MNNFDPFPKDENGDLLREMFDRGDDQTQPRIIDFSFAFPKRRQALVFAEAVDDRNLEVCISYYEEREMWQAIVKKYMVPLYKDIGELEALLNMKAEMVGGESEGWGCILVKAKK